MIKYIILFFLSIFTFPAISFSGSVSMELKPETELVAGKSSKIKLKLTEIQTGDLLSEKDLKLAHTKKLHLLVIDPTLTDYQHIHPIEIENTGEFTFNFTPKKEGNYRFWADITPIKTGTQEYVIADLGKKSEVPAVI